MRDRPVIGGAGPRLTAAEAARLAGELYGLRASAHPLAGERDGSFLLEAVGGGAYVLKVSPAEESAEVLECRDRVLARLNAAGLGYRFPRVVPLRREPEEAVWVAGGVARRVRLLEWVPGRPLAEVRPHGRALLEAIGEMLGAVDRVMEGFDAPGAHRELRWELGQGRAFVEGHVAEVEDAGRRALVEHFATLYDRHVEGEAGRLRRSVIHGDANDHNVIVSAPVADPLRPVEVVGLIDFGDVTWSYTVAEPAIAAAYALLGKRDPIAAAAAVVRGYHGAYPLSEAELAVLFPSIALRLCVSVVNSARERRRQPENAYVSISEVGAWEALGRLREVSPEFAHYALRHACGMEPCPGGTRVAEWLGSQREGFAAPVAGLAAPAGVEVFDLGIEGTDFAELAGRDDPGSWTAALLGRLRARGVRVGIGRYGEVHRWNTGDAYRVDTDEGPEWRTVHLGVDLFAEPGTAVRAVVDGRVHAVRGADPGGDPGPAVILEHEPVEGVRFYTVYGGLAPGDPDGPAPGAVVRRGQRLGRIGAPAETGGRAPHVHFQVALGPPGRDGVPTSARPSERALWLALCPDPSPLLGVSAGLGAGSGPGAPELLAARRERIGPLLSVSYRRPLHIVRGWMQHLYDDTGRAYLDAVNNVAHVGHAHPHVVAALSRQAAILNTNTRYLHRELVRYAERLTALLPAPLRVCYFVCSGSEANELALRLARAHTGREDVIVLEGAYHGNTTSLVEISPYKFDGPGGRGAPPHVHTVVMPDPYRGPYRGDGPDVGRRYADHVRLAAEAAGARGGAGAFFCEALLGCGGQIVLPDGYLAEAFRHVRAAGGVCIADEVQVGFGRVGTHFWGFETQGVIPDIVTLGKPIGNGHPLGAVITTPEIAASFANGMEYFNTFGGNPVSCAVGQAVLDVIEAERLMERARETGQRLLAGLRDLQQRHPSIGDVRGRGLFIGIELVMDRGALTPAPRLASYVAERMRDHGVLVGTDGPLANVLKIKPPLVFGPADADRLIDTLDRVLSEDPCRSVAWA